MKSKVKIEKECIEISKKRLMEVLILYSIFIVIYYFKFFRFRVNYSNDIFFKYIAPIFIYYYFKFIYIFSKEKILIENKNIIIIKLFLYIPISKQKIKIEDIQMIIYRETLLPNLFEIILFPFLFKNSYNIVFQANEQNKIKNFFCGNNIIKEDYDLIKNEIIRLCEKRVLTN